MSEQLLYDALEDCIERMGTGQSLDECLRAHPQHADRLRDLLRVAVLVGQASKTADVTSAQMRGRARLAETMRHKGGRKRKETRRGWVLPLVATLATVLSLGALFAGVQSVQQGTVTDLQFGEAAQVAGNPTGEAQLRQTQDAMYAHATGSVEAFFLTLTPAPTMTAEGRLDRDGSEIAMLPTSVVRMDELMATPLAPIMTSTASMYAIPEDGLMLTATAIIARATEVALADSETRIITPAPVPFTGIPPSEAALVTTHEMPPMLNPSQVYLPDVTYTPMPSQIYIPPSMTPAPSQGAQQQLPPPSSTPSPAQLAELFPLNAGEIDDNADWDRYLLYRRNFLRAYPDFPFDVDVIGRQIITVTDTRGYPVLGALVRVYNGDTLVSATRTYATGQTLFFPNAVPESEGAFEYRVVVDKDQVQTEFTLRPQDKSTWMVKLDLPPQQAHQESIKLDVLFLLDSTGSMGDEIAQLQSNILAISAQIDTLPGSVDAHYGLVTYRDRGDEYVTRVFDFTPDVYAFQTNLMSVRADAGGDEPESLNEGLHRALNDVTWRGEDAVKLVFLVADAPPHLDYANDYNYLAETRYAAGQGIKIHPLASSGLNQLGEYIFRQIAQQTMGHFLFLTYADDNPLTPGRESGEERPDLEAGASGGYSVTQLDELVLRLIQDELAALTTRVEQ